VSTCCVPPEGFAGHRPRALGSREPKHSRRPKPNDPQQAIRSRAALRVARLHAMQQYGDQLPPYPFDNRSPRTAFYNGTASPAPLMKDWDESVRLRLVPGRSRPRVPGGDNVLRREMDMAIQRSVAPIMRSHAAPVALAAWQRAAMERQWPAAAVQAHPTREPIAGTNSGGRIIPPRKVSLTSGGKCSRVAAKCSTRPGFCSRCWWVASSSASAGPLRGRLPDVVGTRPRSSIAKSHGSR